MYNYIASHCMHMQVCALPTSFCPALDLGLSARSLLFCLPRAFSLSLWKSDSLRDCLLNTSPGGKRKQETEEVGGRKGKVERGRRGKQRRRGRGGRRENIKRVGGKSKKGWTGMKHLQFGNQQDNIGG